MKASHVIMFLSIAVVPFVTVVTVLAMALGL